MSDYIAFQDEMQALERLALSSPGNPLFKLVLDENGTWYPISFLDCWVTVNSIAVELREHLSSHAIPPGSLLTLWISGFRYLDAVHILAFMRAGYGLHLCSMAIDDRELVYALMMKCNSKALFYDPGTVGHRMEGWNHSDLPFFHLLKLSVPDIAKLHSFKITPWCPRDSDVALVLQTSGSVGGMPKPLKRTFKWVRESIRSIMDVRSDVTLTEETCIYFTLGSHAHSLGFNRLMRSIVLGHCQVLAEDMQLNAGTISFMMKELGLNSLDLFSPGLSRILEEAQQNSDLLALLCRLESIDYGGADIPIYLTDWAFEQGIPLMNNYGMTECRIIMRSGASLPSSILFPLDEGICQFISLDTIVDDEDGQNAGRRELFELVVPESSPNCPSNGTLGFTGDFHSSDIFEKLKSGGFIWRSRAGDFIKNEFGKKIDTKSLENDVYQRCSDLVDACIVVGEGRPAPYLIIEPKEQIVDHLVAQWLKQQVFEHLRPLASRLYSHERITSPDMIMVASRGELPRTAKGNIKRAAVEAKYKEILDQAYV